MTRDLRIGHPVVVDGLTDQPYGHWVLKSIDGDTATIAVVYPNGQSDLSTVAVSRLSPLLGRVSLPPSV